MEFELGYYKGWILGILLLLIVTEMIWSWRNDRKVYDLKETITNTFILIGFQLSKLLFTGYQLTLLNFSHEIAPYQFSKNSWVFIITFIAADFVYYWYHRISHTWKPLWAFHLIHHSATKMNFTTAYRLNWLGTLISPLFFVPLSLSGFPPDFIALSFALNLFYQFFLHTESIGKIKPLEGILDTPSAHRVHHGSNDQYIDKNFGGVIMLWDRIFGTYQPEKEKVKYGITTGFVSYNPFVLVFHGFVDLIKKRMNYKG